MKKRRAEPLSRHDRARLADLNYCLTMLLSLMSEWLPRFRQASGRQAAICFHADNTIYQTPWNCCLLNARKGWAPGHQCHWNGDQWQQMEQGPALPAGLRPVTLRQQGKLQVSWNQKSVSVQRESMHLRWGAMTSEEGRQGCRWLPWALGLQLEQQNPSWDVLGVRDVSGHSWIRLQ